MSFITPLRRTTATAATTATTTTARTTFICSQCRHASLLRRPKRPYQFTQLITMSDGSTFTHRTSSPIPVYRSTRDTRNSLMWNPSSSKLASVEKDEAGRMAAFRAKFGRSFDANVASADPAAAEAKATKEADAKQAQAEAEEEDDNLLDLISSFGQQEAPPPQKKSKY
ncbi:mitochondrial 54S ribosomal protein bL31m [Aspergillus saccharolyticus JOP 1030-1]|uniref:Ribosomal protein bL31m N-terminal domain-containing protein n=1 Tax=Aspergillus saccharolyticus JOP 1030-1 TaxID=1450539 RepID=A0A318Z6N3_9EURO|nr:hypothetical protein BP01DRAFT_359685 [Aspergillus saccharolyticus JOP 1030-1]PYH42067.1 hypothetical protein BP01DRAFT_359685 [Aspergillus saccharolyticus JOP 1030-1]